jgi:hypothetical protein
MITPKLEELILCGKAFFKTAVVGGSKTTINIKEDRFIIIIDISYLGYQNPSPLRQQWNFDQNIQLSIYGERGFNHYIFKNKGLNNVPIWDPDNDTFRDQSYTTQAPPQQINCYILHTTQVGFSFISQGDLNPSTTLSIAGFDNPAFEPPLDYGKEGMLGAVNVDVLITPNTLDNFVVNRNAGLPIGSNATQQIQFPADASTKPLVNENIAFPIANINYIEILGQPNNIGI